MTDRMLRNGLLGAAAMNVGGVLLLSKAFTNEAVNEADPVVMSNFGLLMIVVWGLAYAGAAAIRTDLRWLLGVFAIEKLVYGIAWVKWLSANSLSALYERDSLAGVFFGIYGFNDLAFMVFFIMAIVSKPLPASSRNVSSTPPSS